MQQHDPFRPRSEPAAMIYGVLTAEATKRPGLSVEQWVHAERLAVWNAACSYAGQLGVAPPTIQQIEVAERCAVGHADFAVKWAHGVASLLIQASPTEFPSG